jgi:hypothetical protein
MAESQKQPGTNFGPANRRRTFKYSKGNRASTTASSPGGTSVAGRRKRGRRSTVRAAEFRRKTVFRSHAFLGLCSTIVFRGDHMKIYATLLVFTLYWPMAANEPGTREKRPMQVELDVFSGRPNPVWSLTNEQAKEFLAHFKGLKSTNSKRAPYNGLGYRGFKVTGFQDYDELAIWDKTVEARRGDKRNQWVDEHAALQKFLLKTSKSHIDEALYRSIAAAIDKD